MKESELVIGGMSCGNCAQHVTEALRSVPGVASAEVSLQQGRAHVRWQNGDANVSRLIEAVAAAGYEAKAAQTTEKPSIFAGWKFNVMLGVAGTVPLMLGEWVFRWNGRPWFNWSSFAIALFIQVACGARFYRGAWRQLRVGGSNMDTLVALGSTAAFGYSAWLLFSGMSGHLYFMEAAAIITLISVGHWMEELAGAYAEKSLRALFQLAPETAVRQNADGTETEIAMAELHPGDLAIVRPGARIPTDGIIEAGQGTVNESMLTGESMPVAKMIGTNLYAGTISLDGRLTMRVTGVAQDTAVAHIIQAVERAQSSRAQIQRLADRISNVFVPVVVIVAIAAGLWWGLDFARAKEANAWLANFLWTPHLAGNALSAGVLAAVAVLIVACPCAMGLATPVAIMAGTNAAAKRGILIRDGIALEKAGRLTSVLMDKTGTLTLGQPEVAQFTVIGQRGGEMALAASLAHGSNHPLSQAVAKISPEKVGLAEWKEIRGSGVEARQDRSIVRLGSLPWLKSVGVTGNEAGSEKEEGSILGLAVNNELTALITLRDRPKPGIAEAVAKLKSMGLNVFMVTGDNSRTAAAIASLAGIPAENVFAEVRPERKAEIVQELQAKGERVAFVGDGINDAPALEQSDLGIAVSDASDVAGEAADIILLQSNMHAIPEAIDLARAALRTIRQNLFWAFFYNAAAIPLAALGFLSPILCAAAMGFSDLIVIGNAIRLGRRKIV